MSELSEAGRAGRRPRTHAGALQHTRDDVVTPRHDDARETARPMPLRTVTRADLSEAVYQRIGLSRAESSELVEMVIDEVSSAIVRGEPVKLSSFGSFLVRHKSERVGRNPKTGVEVPITPRRVLVFKASNVLKARTNGVADDAAA